VRLPIDRAATWSADTPAWMSAPDVLRAWVPVRKVVMARAWSPPPSPLALAFLCARPVSTLHWPRRLESGSSVDGSLKSLPSVVGVQSGMWTPLGE